MIIYRVTNTVNGKIYIGKTKFTLSKRRSIHERSRKNFLFARAIRKYGKENFKWEVLEKDIDNEENLCRLEKHYIWFYKASKKEFGYNLTDGGEGVSNPDESVRKKMKEKQLGKKNSNFKHGKYSGKHFCTKCGKELDNTNLAVLCKSCCKLGKKFTDQHRERISLAKMGEKNPAKQQSVRDRISRTVKKLWQEGIYRRKEKTMGSSSFFQNKDCEFWGKCHTGIAEEDFSCLFCYCPWFWDCGFKNAGLSCPDCTFPHRKEMYANLMQGLKIMYDKRITQEESTKCVN